MVFAVLLNEHPPGRVVAFLRYVPSARGLVKVGSTRDSFSYLEVNHPDYIITPHGSDVWLQGVPLADVAEHIKPEKYLEGIRCVKQPTEIQRKIMQLVDLLSERSGVHLDFFGVTGSVLVGAENESSDIDLVVYRMDNFQKARAILSKPEDQLQKLGAEAFKSSYAKRFPQSRDISFEEFVFHENRKHTSGVFEGKKFDILFAPVRGTSGHRLDEISFRKLGNARLKSKVLDDSDAFSYPAVYKVDGESGLDGKLYEVSMLVSYTHTYVGQVFAGETVVASGILEEVSSTNGLYYRLIVGSSREAAGEFIKLS